MRSTAREPRVPDRPARAPARSWLSRHRVALVVPLLSLASALRLLPVRQLPTDVAGTNTDVNALQARARRANELTWLRADVCAIALPARSSPRSDLVHEKDRLRTGGDA